MLDSKDFETILALAQTRFIGGSSNFRAKDFTKNISEPSYVASIISIYPTYRTLRTSFLFSLA